MFNPIGYAMEYPLRCTSGSAALVTGQTAIEQSIEQILNTEIGSLPASPFFGSRLPNLLFELEDAVAINVGASYIREAIGAQEGRVRIVSIQGAASGAVVRFTINYAVRATGEMRTMVYPFERTLIR